MALSSGVSDEKLTALVAEQISAGMLLSLSDVPSWFAAGAGRTIAARVEPKSPLVKKWETEVQNLPATANADVLVSVAIVDSETSAQLFLRAQPDAEASAIPSPRHGSLTRAGFRRGVDRGVSARRSRAYPALDPQQTCGGK